MNQQQVFSERSIPKAVTRMALPTVMSMLVTIFYNMADTFFVGQTGDPNQVAAVSLTMPVFMLLMAIGNIFGMGGSSLISRLLGAGEETRVRRVSSFSFWGCVVCGVAFSACILIFMNPILSLIGCSANTEAFARDYLFYIAIGGATVTVSNAMANVVRAEGAATAAMIGMMIGTVVNIVLDPIMILWMDMGVAGAAIATILGNLLATVYYIYYFLRKSSALSIKFSDFAMGEGILTGVFAIGIPAAVNSALMSLANIVLNNFLAGYGDQAVAAMGVAMKANMLVVLLQIGVAQGVLPLIGYNYGTGDHDRLKKTLRFTIGVNIVLGTVLSGLYFLGTRGIIAIFINDVQVIDYGVMMLRALMISGPFLGILFVLNAAFQAMGKAVPALVLSLSRQGLVFLPVLVLLNRLVGLEGIVYAQPVADIASIVLAVIMFAAVSRGLSRRAAASDPKTAEV